MLRASDVRLHPSKNSRSPGRPPEPAAAKSLVHLDTVTRSVATHRNKSRAKRPGRKLCKNNPDPLSYDDWLGEEACYRAVNDSGKFATCRREIEAGQEANRNENGPM
ncbi:hypothetical protein BTUL_0039g00310 [Botrytis tulipae]|uniref:Uncharacterized protein n=1 Tax=Botrytis tulipae TaxID=87230 RepID=A0A4Z1F245_9HELO|nr:hypothetical protein BTUL_0039g00310 [Botrytis tulipae]